MWIFLLIGISDIVVYLLLLTVISFYHFLWISDVSIIIRRQCTLSEQAMFWLSSGKEMSSSFICSYLGRHGEFQRSCPPWNFLLYIWCLVDYKVPSEVCLQKAEADFLLGFQNIIPSDRNFRGNHSSLHGFNW